MQNKQSKSQIILVFRESVFLFSNTQIFISRRMESRVVEKLVEKPFSFS